MSEDPNEDLLLRKLGNLARFDDRWDRLAAGTLSDEEAAELRALAETSEEAREAYEAFRPLGPSFHDAVVRKIQASALAPPAKLLPFPRRAFRLVAWGAVAAAAAALVVFLRPPTLPGYSLAEISGGSRATRGEATEPAVWAPGDRFQATLRPQTEVKRTESLDAQASLRRGHELRRLRVRTQVDERGAVRLEGSLDPDLPPGDWTLWVVVGRRGALPDPAGLQSSASAAPVRERNWVAVPLVLRIHPKPL
jgi:hypothetical protein